MREYKFYPVRKDGHISEPPTINHWLDDRTAVPAAKRLVNGHDIEIWQGPRLVAYVVSEVSTGQALPHIDGDQGDWICPASLTIVGTNGVRPRSQVGGMIH